MGEARIDARVAAALQHGVVALLSKKVARWTGQWQAQEVVLVGVSMLCALAEWRRLRANLMLSWLGMQVAQGTLLNVALAFIGQGGAWIGLVNTLAVYLIISRFEQQLSGSAQYIFAENFAKALRPWGPASWAFVGVSQQALRGMPRLRECASLVAVQLFQFWLAESIPATLRFFTTVLLLYFSEGAWPGGLGGEVHSFAVYAVSSDLQSDFAPLWVQFLGFWLASTVAWDDTTVQLFLLCALHAGTGFIMSFFDSVAGSDPYLAILGVGVSVAVALKVR